MAGRLEGAKAIPVSREWVNRDKAQPVLRRGAGQHDAP